MAIPPPAATPSSTVAILVSQAFLSHGFGNGFDGLRFVVTFGSDGNVGVLANPEGHNPHDGLQVNALAVVSKGNV